MINLLTPEERLATFKLYRWRLLAVVLAYLALAFIVAVVALLPTYIIFANRNVAAEVKYKQYTQSDDAKQVEQSLAVISQLEERVSVLRQPSAIKMTELLAKISDHLVPGITLKKISHQRGSPIAISGVAKTRESLREFVRALESEEMFAKVDSPLSNLIAGKDISFTISIALSAKAGNNP